ncbi:helix-turn-helix domain-containing protein [Dyadobacter sediminis]|uniref:Helix-turn-helix transcriptional regulator n=1 Tax=Dyadobacter sediminis TaxID=1493691 RepID=A0A5R9KBG3_9BACT|nr:helix-turn-helix transcriptional regulator [Dyadobacter sediminis]TLU92146.1 helix-turn-helix transcriptional regulator [Dyadobacter sediminis]GGB97028.1 AraC family transcriptional regulator [Dyadobacter sediminis]
MKTEAPALYRFESLNDFHRVFGLPKPVHPLVSFIKIEDMKISPDALPPSIVLPFYKIAYKTSLCGKARYGQNYYDFGEGGLVFTAPGQIFESPVSQASSGYILLVHPDFFLRYPLAGTIRQYRFFTYAANEALYLSDKERTVLFSVFSIIEEELNSRIDHFSQDVLISQIELLLNYSNRFYGRQFITRKSATNDLLQRMESVLDDYLNSGKSSENGIPTVQFLAEKLDMSASYLSDMLRSLTGENALYHIHEKLVEKAKEKLSTSNLSVSEIAFELGFDYPQSFSRLFKTKTSFSPLAFRQSFN